MAGNPVTGGTRNPTGGTQVSSQLARWAVGLAAVVAVVIAVSGAIIALAYARAGSDAISDNWIGILGTVALIGGLLASLVAFALAIAARVKHERWAWLWFPLSMFPVLLAFVVLGEVFWWE